MAFSPTLAAVVAALAASLCYAVGAALQQQQASRAATGPLVHPRVLWQVARRPKWLAGFAAMLAGEVLHVLALAWAPLAVVQPIGVTTVLFAPLVGAVLVRARPRVGDLAAAALTVGGLAALLTGIHVSTGPPSLDDFDLALLIPVIGGGLVALILLALRSSARTRTVLLGCGAGATFGTTAALMRLLTHRIASDGAAGLVSWVTPVLVAVAIVGLLLEQAAYRSGHLGAAVAGYAVTDPLVAVAVGVCVLHQPAWAPHPLLSVVEAVVVVAGVVLLAHKAAAPSPRPDTPRHRRAALTAPTSADQRLLCCAPSSTPAGVHDERISRMPVAIDNAEAAGSGEYVTETLDYDGGRQVTVYVPARRVEAVVFAADGGLISQWGPDLEAWDDPSTMVVGVHRHSDETVRLHEYSPRFDARRFAAHERFVVADVRRWVESRFDVATLPGRTAVCGVSAGGELALALGLRHPEMFGAIWCASPGAGYKPPAVMPRRLPRTYLVAGTGEPFFLANAERWAAALGDSGGDVVLFRREGSHGGPFWRAEFPRMVRWAFGR